LLYNFGDLLAWNDSSHTREEFTSGGTFIGGAEPTQGSLEDAGRILKNTAYSNCNYLKHLDFFS